ncbi:MAG: hypothetical protein K6G07_03055, partial [Lachnospiraceae bacterium]|nr:hypothetical protein [Lachnospiraceae bacterium]
MRNVVEGLWKKAIAGLLAVVVATAYLPVSVMATVPQQVVDAETAGSDVAEPENTAENPETVSADTLVPDEDVQEEPEDSEEAVIEPEGVMDTEDASIPAPDETYNSNNVWSDTLIITANKTVKLRNLVKDNTGSASSPIKICGNVNVNLVIEGDVVLRGNSYLISAGIEVEEGATVNIYGLPGSTLTVTGGKYGAGIGGIGYGDADASNDKAGNINIYSGTITATAGTGGGAGIGSGQHSSASNITIYGGNIKAIGTDGGAGIGSGYGTSGNSNVVKVGDYDGGNIRISGGIVRAAAVDYNFDDFNFSDTSTWYATVSETS